MGTIDGDFEKGEANGTADALAVLSRIVDRVSQKVGVVQTPHHFFNPDPMEHSFCSDNCLPDEQRYFLMFFFRQKTRWGLHFLVTHSR
jgi:hypothetical protein